MREAVRLGDQVVLQSYAGEAQHLPDVWVAVRAGLRRVLDGTSLEQRLSGDLPADVRHLAQDSEAWQNR